MSPAGSVVPTTVLGFLDRRPAAAGEYLNLHLSGGHVLRLSANHVTFSRRRPEGLFAGEVGSGEELVTRAENGTAVYSRVGRVTRQVMTGEWGRLAVCMSGKISFFEDVCTFLSFCFERGIA